MRGRSLIIASLGAAVLAAGGGVALSSSGADSGESGATDRAAARPLPDPIPERLSRPDVVEPAPGETADAAAANAGEAVPAGDDVPVDAKVGRSAADGVDLARVRAGNLTKVQGDDAVRKADVLDNGVALPPLQAPEEVRQIIEAGNSIARAPYLWGGGHGKWQDKGYDCSGSVSYALASAGLLNAPLASGPLMQWGKPGKGKWITIYSNPGHVFMVVAGVRFDTSGQKVTGSRWQNSMRSGGSFVARHPPGL